MFWSAVGPSPFVRKLHMNLVSAKVPGLVHETRLDFIRVMACVAVVLLHVSARPIYMQEQLSAWAWLAGNAVSSLTHWCVPVFVMLSGALLLGSEKTTYRNMLCQRIPRMLLVLALASAFYALWQKFFFGGLVWAEFARALVAGQPYYHLHFFYLIIGLYFITPVLSRAIIALSEQELRHAVWVTCGLTMAVFAWSTFSRTYTPNGASYSWWYIGYFLLGHYLHRYSPQLPYLRILLLGYGVTVVGTQLLAYVMGSGYLWKLYFYTYFSPTVLAMAIGVWGIAGRWAQGIDGAVLRALAPLTLLVYILHPMFMELLRWAYPMLSARLMAPVIEVPLTFVLTLLVSSGAAWLLRRNRLVKRYF